MTILVVIIYAFIHSDFFGILSEPHKFKLAPYLRIVDMLDRPPCGAAIYCIAGLLQFWYERMAKRVLAHKVYGCWVYGADFGIIAFGNQ